MFKNNIKGNKNKIKITQSIKKEDKRSIITEILIGLFVTVIGGIILYLVIGG